MSKERILIVEDDVDLSTMLKIYFEAHGYEILTAGKGRDALEIGRRQLPNVVVLDIRLPDLDGYEVCRQLRSNLRTSHIPVLFLTQRDERSDKIAGLELGADDYITKPFDTNVLLARMKAVLRRAQRGMAGAGGEADTSVVTVGDLTIDPSAYVATLRGQPLDLSPREFDLLHALALEAGRVLSVDDLLARVWGAEYVGESQVVYVHIRWLRQKLEDDASNPTRIMTVRGKGYKLLPQGTGESS